MSDATLLEGIVQKHSGCLEILKKGADLGLDGFVVVGKNARIIFSNSIIVNEFDAQPGNNYFRCMFGLDPETQQGVIQRIPAHQIISGSRTPTEPIRSILTARDGIAYYVETSYNSSWQAVYEVWHRLGIPDNYRSDEAYIDLT